MENVVDYELKYNFAISLINSKIKALKQKVESLKVERSRLSSDDLERHEKISFDIALTLNTLSDLEFLYNNIISHD